MLNHIHIRHFAIIDETELELHSGMTALTGESGAGKSILLDALGQVLGARSQAGNIQQDADRAEVTASFDIDSLPTVQQWLTDNDLDDDNQCLMRRVLSRGGKNRASINGRPVSVQMLRELGEQLLNIHGQNEHQQLAKPAAQLALLDAFTQSPLPEQVKQAYAAWQSANKKLTLASDDSQEKQNRLDLLKFQLQEFDALDIGGSSIASIESEHQWLANADKLMQLSQSALQSLDADAGAQSTLAGAVLPLTELVSIDERMRECLDLVESAHIQAAEATSLLRNYASSMDHDGNRLAWLDDKLSNLHRLAKKHQVDITQLDTVETALRDELDNLSAPELEIDKLEQQVNAQRQVYLDLAKKLSRLRKRHAKTLSKTVTDSMQNLAMTGGVFDIAVSTDTALMQLHGQDNIVFNVSPNPGIKPAPLAKVASGGELSRIGLCIQLATIGSNQVSTLIFDEVDAGIGGAVAETVGQLLRQVGEHAQVLCVTHLPQVAVQAHSHLLVQKSVETQQNAKGDGGNTNATLKKGAGKGGKTKTLLKQLNKTETRDEIARMLGGSKITKKTRQHAEEMIAEANA